MKGANKIDWPIATVTIVLITGVVILGGLGQSVTELISLGVAILGALLYGEVRGIRQQSNGTMTALVDALIARQGGSDPHAPDGGNPPEVPR